MLSISLFSGRWWPTQAVLGALILVALPAPAAFLLAIAGAVVVGGGVAARLRHDAPGLPAAPAA